MKRLFCIGPLCRVRLDRQEARARLLRLSWRAARSHALENGLRHSRNGSRAAHRSISHPLDLSLPARAYCDSLPQRLSRPISIACRTCYEHEVSPCHGQREGLSRQQFGWRVIETAWERPGCAPCKSGYPIRVRLASPPSAAGKPKRWRRDPAGDEPMRFVEGARDGPESRSGEATLSSSRFLTPMVNRGRRMSCRRNSSPSCLRSLSARSQARSKTMRSTQTDSCADSDQWIA